MGYGQDPGVIPRLTEQLFAEKANLERSGSALRIWVRGECLYTTQAKTPKMHGRPFTNLNETVNKR